MPRHGGIWIAALLIASASAGAQEAELPQAQRSDPRFRAGAEQVRRSLSRVPLEGRARNVVLFVGDGMGIATVVATRILAGQRAGGPGEEHFLAFERFPHVALARTYSVDRQVPDSAATMTALMTGVKTRGGVIGVGPGVERGRCPGAEAATLRTALELAELSGRSTGVVTDTRLTHATPAATYAHAADREWEDDSDLESVPGGAGCRDIAAQLLAFPLGDGLEVALGGGRRHFLPKHVADPEHEGERGKRRDGRDLTAEWAARPRSRYVWDAAGLRAVDPEATDHLLGLFAPSHLAHAADRSADAPADPSLAEMTSRALDLLERNPRGFFLVVEGGLIDQAHHAGDAERALLETLELARAVELVVERTDERETLVIVTADHGDTLAISGWHAPRGNPVLGPVLDHENGRSPARDLEGRPYPLLSYANGPRGAVPLERGSHSAEDVAVYARGPWAHLVDGSIEQGTLFHVIVHAAGLSGAAGSNE